MARIPTHIASQYRVLDDLGVIVYDSGEITNYSELTSYIIHEVNDFPNGTDYTILVRFKSSEGAWSQWGKATGLTIERVDGVVNKPSLYIDNTEVVRGNRLSVYGSDFSSTKDYDTHIASKWYISEDYMGSNPVITDYSETDLTSHVFDTRELSPNKTYYVFVRYEGKKFGFSPQSNGVMINIVDLFINKPWIVTPEAYEGVDCNNSLTTTSSPFQTTHGYDVHVKSDWQLFSDNGGIKCAIAEDYNTDDLTSHTFDTTLLENGTTYYIRVRYHGLESKEPSEWSDYQPFICKKAEITTPYIIEPFANATIDFIDGITMKCSAFHVDNGSDTHIATEWRITRLLDNVDVYDVKSENNLTQHQIVDLDTFAGDTQYKATCRQYGFKTGASAWSAPVIFSTYRTGVQKPIIISPENGTVIQSFGGSLTLEGSPFMYHNRKENHVASIWTLMDIAGGILQVDNSEVDLLKHTIKSDKIKAGNSYRASLAYVGSSTGNSFESDDLTVAFIPPHGTDYHGFKVGRFDNTASFITFKDWTGEMRTIAIKDAAYRNILPLSLKSIDIVSRNFTSGNSEGNWFVGSEDIVTNEPMPEWMTNDFIYELWGETLKDLKSGKDNMQDYLDLIDISYMPAIQWVQSQLIGDASCILPNAYEAMVIWACGDMLDQLDQSDTPTLFLGYKSNGNGYKGGRYQSYDGKKSNALQSLTEYSSSHTWAIFFDGSVNKTNSSWSKNSNLTTIPILEVM